MTSSKSGRTIASCNKEELYYIQNTFLTQYSILHNLKLRV